LPRVLVGRQKYPQRTQNSFFVGFFMAASELTRNALVKVQNKRKKIIIERN
jgi:CRISPR/Cas system-associated endoribonuclease Cas2